MNERLLKLIGLILLVFAFLSTVQLYFFRPVWFDETITVLEFVRLGSAWKIYLTYNIPNNHILYTIVLKYFLDLNELFFPLYPYTSRIPSVLFAAGAAISFYLFLKGKCGWAPALITTLSFLLSPAFGIYATAIRGYMLSFLLLTIFLHLAGKTLKSPSLKNYIFSFIVAIMAVAVMPTNIIALCASAAIYCPRKIQGIMAKKFLFLFLGLPVLALIFFYLPIFDKFLASVSLKEGFDIPSKAALNLYGGFLLAAFVPLVAAIPGIPQYFKKGFSYLPILAMLALFLLPLPFFFLKEPPVFPRMFFSLWPLWLTILAFSAKRFMSRRNGTHFKLTVIVAALLCFAWNGVMSERIPEFAKRFSSNAMNDDYIRPWYCDPAYSPGTTAKFIKDYRSESKSDAKVFLSFKADPQAIAFYARMMDVPDSIFEFTLGRRKGSVSNLGKGDLIICAQDENIPEALASGLAALPLSISRYHVIYIVTDKE